MAEREHFVFQPYIRGKRGVVAPAPAIACRNAGEAQRRADKAMDGGRFIGGHVVRMMVDEAAGEYSEPEFLASVGIVPESV